MKSRSSFKPFHARTRITRKAALLAVALSTGMAAAHADTPPAIDASNWGSVTAPVFGSTEPSAGGIYSIAELFAGPNNGRFADSNYYHGVLPNGKIVDPAGSSIQIGQNPLGTALTPDGKYLITTNDDERNSGPSLQSATNQGGYSLSVVDTRTWTVVSQINTQGRYFIGLSVAASAGGTYTVYASGGGDNSIKVFTVSGTGTIAFTSAITIAPSLPSSQGYVTNYIPSAALAALGTQPNVQAPSQFKGSNPATTFPAGSALSPNGKFLYVACNGDNSLAVIDTTSNTVVKQIPVGFFPYTVSVSADPNNSGIYKVLVTNWGIAEYKFLAPTYDTDPNSSDFGQLTALGHVGPDDADGLSSLFYTPVQDTATKKTSSVSIIKADENASAWTALGNVSMSHPLDDLNVIGDTHPSGSAIVKRGGVEVLYVTKANNDSLGVILLNNFTHLPDVDLSPLNVTVGAHKVHASYPNAIVASADGKRLYVAEAGLNSVAVLDTGVPTKPKLIGRIPTGWYPTALALDSKSSTLYVLNAKGVGEDINPHINDGNPAHSNPPATGVESHRDSNYIFGSAQKITLANQHIDNKTVLGYNYALNTPADSSVVPIGGKASSKIDHVFFILHENKTFDTMLGNQGAHFGNFASTNFNALDGTTGPTISTFVSVALNTQTLAKTFAAAVNYYSDSEESDAGHQFAASGTATDYTEKTLLVKFGRGMLVNKNFEPEDYPEGGYIFNNAARNGVSFKDYGALLRIQGTDTGDAKNTLIDDPASGKMGFPDTTLTTATSVTNVLGSDTTSATDGVGQADYQKQPILAILGSNDPITGEARLDHNYPGYNFNISDQRRAVEFCKDFDRMVNSGTLPKYLYIYQPNDHTGGTKATNIPAPTAAQEVEDGDVGLGMVVSHIMKSSVYYTPADATKNTAERGSAIFITYDDAQSSPDHIHEHRTPLIVVSPFARVSKDQNGSRTGFIGTRHYVTASVVKTEELLLGLPPNNYGDLFATDLRDLFQSTYNGITLADLTFNQYCKYVPTNEGRKIWTLVAHLDTSAPDRDSHRLGVLSRLSMTADSLHKAAAIKHHLTSKPYLALQARLYKQAVALVQGPAPRDSDD